MFAVHLLSFWIGLMILVWLEVKTEAILVLKIGFYLGTYVGECMTTATSVVTVVKAIIDDKNKASKLHSVTLLISVSDS
jgi:hypothetical protein